MKMHEYQARKILSDYHIPTSRGRVAFSPEEAASVFETLGQSSAIAKVQVLMGGRGKAGGVVRVHSAAEAKAFALKFLGKPFSTTQSAGESKTVRSVLVTEDNKILEEYYLGITIDRSHQKPVILFSKQGGMEIEEVAAAHPEAITKVHFTPEKLPAASQLLPAIQKDFTGDKISLQIAQIAANLCRLFVEKDVALCEINPLALVPNEQVVALDAKIVFDDNALFRHEEIAAMKDPEEEDERERKAKQFGLSYVSMDGNVGCLVNGAGLAMATMDMIKLAGGEPANFLDVGGGATADMVREGFKIILQDSRVMTILVNIFGGIMKCDVIAEGVIQASREIQLQVPLVVRLEGTNVEQGRELLKNSGLRIISCHAIDEAARQAVEQAKAYRNSHVHTR
jgi:succinyl-CoA synthetase beta subunit